MGRQPQPIRDVHRARLEAGERCHVVRQDGRIVGMTWFARGVVRVEFLACELLLGDDEVYLHDSFVAPTLRGHGMAAAVYATLADELAHEGVGRLLGLVRIYNRANRRSLARAGFRSAGALVRITVAGRTWHFGNARVAYRSRERDRRPRRADG